MHLTDRHLHRLHAALQHLRAPLTLDTFPERALSAVTMLVPADQRGYIEVNPQTRQMRVVGLSDEVRFSVL
jgi:hypothetical protein